MFATLRRVALPALLLLLAGGAAAQDTTFDDQWFKLKVSATFRTLGAEICDGAVLEQGTEYTLRGGATIKGKTVPVAKLPFTPPT